MGRELRSRYLDALDPAVYADDFEISSGGVLSFRSAPDFEVPSGGSNVYEVTVEATAGSFSGSLAVAVTVTDVDEAVIAGEALVGYVLRVDTSEIAGGLTDPRFTYQWLADGEPITGATRPWYVVKYFREGQAISVAVSFTDDDGNDETVTSAPTAAVGTVPLVASAENVAVSHDGSSDFTFELRFSEELFALSYVKLKNHAFEVSGGQIRRAQRADTSGVTRNILWRITVSPDGNGDVTVTLPEATDCLAEGAICSQDGRLLSNTVTFTVTGPAHTSSPIVGLIEPFLWAIVHQDTAALLFVGRLVNPAE